MMAAFEIGGFILVAGAIAALSGRHMCLGFALQILSTLCWSVVAIDAELWSLLALQFWLAAWAVRGLLKREFVR